MIKCLEQMSSDLNPSFTLNPIKREFEAKFAALPLLIRLQYGSLHAEGIPLLKMSTIFHKNIAPIQTSLKRSFCWRYFSEAVLIGKQFSKNNQQLIPIHLFP